MARRTGVPSLLEATAEVCRLIAKFGTLIKAIYPENIALHTALDAANVACGALATHLMTVREYGD